MEIEYKKKIRRIYAKEKDGDILLVIPFSLKDDKKSLELGLELVEKLKKKLSKKKRVEIITDTQVLLFWEYVLKSELPNNLTTEKKWANFFKEELYEYTNPLLQEISNKLWFKDVPLRIRKVRTVRGTCSHDNRILLNQTLVHLPTRLIRYVIIHEACHLVQKNHSEKFWNLVENYCPQYKELRKELKNQILLQKS